MGAVAKDHWGFVHRRRFYRWVYATLTLFAYFAVVASFYDFRGKNGDGDKDQSMLQWLYVFYPTPIAFAWFVVYFGQFFCCVRIKRLRKARNYKYNLLLASFAAAFLYSAALNIALSMTFNHGPALRSALIMATCQFGLTCIEVFDERKTRKERHRRKRILREQQCVEDTASEQPLSTPKSNAPSPQTLVISQPPGGLL